MLASAVLIGSLPALQGRQADRAALDDLLKAVGRYVEEYERTFSAVVSKERYYQRARSGGTDSTRVIEAEVALVAIGQSDWMVFRDVYKVDGRVLRDREDRLASLFLKPSPDLGVQAKRIADESARYNLGGISRTINIPTQALLYLRPQHQTQSTFRLGGSRSLDGIDTREVQFQETAKPRLVRTRDNAAASGRVWIVPATGVVARTEFRIRSAGVAALITVSYRRQENLALWAPVAMVESYEQGAEEPSFDGRPLPSPSVIEGRATYSDFRRFSVNTAEIIR